MNEILKKMHEVAASPRAQMDKYLAEGKKIVLCAPVYTPEEIIHSMGFVPMGAWGGDMELNRAKEYCPAFLCACLLYTSLYFIWNRQPAGRDCFYDPRCQHFGAIGAALWAYRQASKA